MTRLLRTAALLFPVAAATARAQGEIDARLLAEVRAVRAVDNHSHIPGFAPPPDDVPADPRGRAPFAYPVRLRIDNPEWAGAWRALYGTTLRDVGVEHGRQALARKRALMRAQGERWPAWVLDRVNVDVALVNAATMGAGLAAPRFRWVPRADALVFPFGAPGARRDPPPASLAEHERAVRAAVARWREGGAVAVKLAIAYRRPIAVAAVDPADAARAWTRLAADPAGAAAGAQAEGYRAVQDHLLRVLTREVGEAGLVLHVHTGIGADPHFRLDGADPVLLEPLVADTALRRTRVVLIHGGWPYERQAGVMLIRPNVWADFSAQTFLRSERELAATIRAWLEWYPEKVLYGTDTYPEGGATALDWEEHLWLANETARRALARALTGMLRDGQITRARAGELARMVLRDNARALYGLDAPDAR